MAEKDHRKGVVGKGPLGRTCERASQYSSNGIGASIPHYLLSTINSCNKQRVNHVSSVSSLSANKKSENVSSNKLRSVPLEHDAWGVARPTCSSLCKHVSKVGNKNLHAHPHYRRSHCSACLLEDEAVPAVKESLASKRLLREKRSFKNKPEDTCAVQDTKLGFGQDEENPVVSIPIEIYGGLSCGSGEFSYHNPLIQENVGSSDHHEFKNIGDGDRAIKILEGRFGATQKPDNVVENFEMIIASDQRYVAWDAVGTGVDGGGEPFFPSDVSVFQCQTVTFTAQGSVEQSDSDRVDTMAGENHEIKIGDDNFTSNAIVELQREQGEVAVQPLEEESPEGEGVLLRHHNIQERKAPHEWMADYALTKIVEKLTPFRGRKVDLLREAFESVSCLNKSEKHQIP